MQIAISREASDEEIKIAFCKKMAADPLFTEMFYVVVTLYMLQRDGLINEYVTVPEAVVTIFHDLNDAGYKLDDEDVVKVLDTCTTWDKETKGKLLKFYKAYHSRNWVKI